MSQNRTRLRRGGYDRFAVDGRVIMRGSHRTLRDGSIIEQAPGNELPGYNHSVPTGLSAFAAVAPSPIRRLAHSPTRLNLSPSILIRLVYVFLSLPRRRVFIRPF